MLKALPILYYTPAGSARLGEPGSVRAGSAPIRAAHGAPGRAPPRAEGGWGVRFNEGPSLSTFILRLFWWVGLGFRFLVGAAPPHSSF